MIIGDFALFDHGVAINAKGDLVGNMLSLMEKVKN